ncbi:hypothetical protein F8388_000684 [Cannabis sativa]|uniref:DUF4283 domain-containing protein n=1 Tax=Cannabis sativa TaxID=3483 RepID=A0A7J6E3I9_CANSA|nr:hypothetical protein F8388_000684 [Cannabis sativa]
MLSSEEPNHKMCSTSMDQMEELLSRTSKLTVTDEDGWEINEEGVADIGKSCLIGRLCTMKPFSRSLLKNILCRLWNLGDTDWDLKIKKNTTTAVFLVLSFKTNIHLERILGKTPWVLNAGFLILERMQSIPTDWETTLSSFTISGRVLNLPIKAITKANMLRLAGMAGDIIDIQEADRSHGLGWIARDHAGLCFAAAAVKLRGEVDPVVAEALSMKGALSWYQRAPKSGKDFSTLNF